MDMDEKITGICFPNTVDDKHKSNYWAKEGYSFEYTTKNGEMASIGWFIISKDGKKIVEVKESVCDIYFNQ